MTDATSTTAPYGSWRSPVSAADLLRGARGLANPQSVDGELFWVESRPEEGGRSVIVRRRSDGDIQDCIPAPFNARCRVHEYGGICYAVHAGVLYFTHWDDQRIYRTTLADDAAPTPPKPLTRAGTRCADFVVDARRSRLIVVAEEDRSGTEPRNFLAAIDYGSADADTGDAPISDLRTGHDFYSTPRLDPAGNVLTWITWDHPHMPWDSTTLWRSVLDEDGRPDIADKLAGGPEEAVVQPGFTPDGAHWCVSDASGWWNLYRVGDDGLHPAVTMQADFGMPHWVFGMRNWTALPDGRIVCTWFDAGTQKLGLYDPRQSDFQPLDIPWTSIDGLVAHAAATADGPAQVCFVGASPTRFAEIVLLDVDSGRAEVLRQASDLELPAADVAMPEAISFATGPAGAANSGEVAHAFYYPPTNAAFAPPAGELPPLLVMIHGGPTAATSPTLSLKVQFWTSRGIAVLDVNYRGSTGYGRVYRNKLRGAWGIVDVEDCVAGARHLCDQQRVDPKRLAIRGGSAGGYTTLAALTFHDTFSAGASHYGVGDLEALARDTHKFESRYLDSMVGPYPEQAELYRERSPINHVDQLRCPVIFFQGLEDKVVPPNQAEAMVAALQAKGIPVAYVPFPGEQHGFRQAANIRRALEAELYFYGQVFAFTPADTIDPVAIDNLP